MSKQIVTSLLKDEKPSALESSDLFSQEEKAEVVKRLTDKSEIESRLALKNKIDSKADWQTLKSKLNIPKKTYYWQYATAASVALIVTLTFLFNKNNTLHNEPVIVDTKIEIGSCKAVLTLSDGSVVALDSTNTYNNKCVKGNGSEIIYGVSETENQNLEFNYLTVPRGGQYHVELSDGTDVWLNSDSQLKYPVNFIKGHPREVELVYGEAYLEVSKSTENHGTAFILKTKQQDITVLGTIFNVKAYIDEADIVTTLVEGSVAVSNSINKNILKPSEQSKLSQDKDDFEISTVEVDEFISWHKGKFSFTNKSLAEIMKVLSRWYDVDILIVNEDLENIGFTGVISKKQPIENILGIIQNTNNMKYTIENKHITIE
ncbi:anti-sigma factor [Formosa agariphila KMM 3901]|uniref:Anti-sigma factor n=1 Tax=Formosa agariphila (strain DSM 15362 / KCTC 12365 / LMG 23005 / KMM 3901 / M-2Alg 35-1) TaxID=1347342 RepID=T2KM98_FORAG|nr:anti-sigma factor [Formosa agariphila KMM 3901]